ncbi:carbon monoxide dehydrogenase subunit G [Marivibrio halodurans]|uniref:Carbon monoxide dehydrogenase subunit G n=1 Tax=Marivibrio halodurans TaxID=2039722 RepID=A0A8J7S1E5_9PROT|nr:carbon monoxide dehydrogenase subunit G [Marivibrio halodurans]MBP5856843.1 carbon monoxide dehydrogenase subunit G [Marivibrio halodurans]
MALEMSGSIVLPAERRVVWEALNDPEVLKACIPGCEALEKVDETSFEARARLKIGPIRASFKGHVELSEIVPPSGYVITGSGDGGVAGHASGSARVDLHEAEDGTQLVYSVESRVGGKIAQLGARLINGVAKRYADEFFTCFAKQIG